MVVPSLSIFSYLLQHCLAVYHLQLSISPSSNLASLICHPLALFPAISASKIFLSMPPPLNSCPINCLLLIVVKSSLSAPTLSKTTSFTSFSVHDILIIFLQNYISAASSFFSIFLLNIHDSHPYNSTDQM